jgi:hypothetical protein
MSIVVGIALFIGYFAINQIALNYVRRPPKSHKKTAVTIIMILLNTTLLVVLYIMVLKSN